VMSTATCGAATLFAATVSDVAVGRVDKPQWVCHWCWRRFDSYRELLVHRRFVDLPTRTTDTNA
jgi:hypothetical protein